MSLRLLDASPRLFNRLYIGDIGILDLVDTHNSDFDLAGRSILETVFGLPSHLINLLSQLTKDKLAKQTRIKNQNNRP
jgi:hypothetical protein